MIDLRALREAAEKATAVAPGPWKWKRYDQWHHQLQDANGRTVLDDGSAGGEYGQQISADDPTGKYVEAVDPAAVLAMVRVCELAKRAHDSVTAFHSAWEADHNAEDLEALHEQLGEALRGME